MIGYYQPNLSTNKIMHTLCLQLDSSISQCMCLVCTSCCHANCYLFFMTMPSSFFFKFCHSIDYPSNW